jgi:transposase
MVRDRSYPGSAKQVERYVRTVRPAARAEAYLRLDTLAGEHAQVDWGHFGPLRVGSTTRLLSCFVFVLSWSRACYARFALDQTRRSPVRPSPPQRLPARGRDAMWCPLIGAAVMVPIGEVLDSTSGDRAGPRRRARHRGSGR